MDGAWHRGVPEQLTLDRDEISEHDDVVLIMAGYPVDSD